MTFQDPAGERPPSAPGRGHRARGGRTPPGPAGHPHRVVADLASTGGGYRLTEATSAPGARVPRHTHDDAVECFYVIAGDYRLTVSGAVHQLGAGDLLLIPRGAPHEFEVVGQEPGRALEVFAPAGFEPDPGLSGRPGPPWRRPWTPPPGPPLPGPTAVVLPGISRAVPGWIGRSGAGPTAPAAPGRDVRSTLVVSLRSDLVPGASWRVGPDATAVWVLAGRYRVETGTGTVALGEGEILSTEPVGEAYAVATAPSSRALVLLL